jgi:hypothetical protein
MRANGVVSGRAAATARAFALVALAAAAGCGAREPIRAVVPSSGAAGAPGPGSQTGVAGAAGTGTIATPTVGGRGGASSIATGSGATMGMPSTCNVSGTGGATMSRVLTPPQFGSSVAQAVPPPAVSGGTLRVLADGQTAVASDPDRDRVYVVDLANRTLKATLALTAGDEPGRVIQDDAGRVHVALRRGGAIVALDATSGELVARRSVCAAPRGLAYDKTGDLVHVACAGGELVSLPAAGGSATRTLRLDGDLRDVVVQGTRLRVSRFRTAELLTVESNGSVSERVSPPSFRAPNARNNQLFTAGVAWRTMAMPDGAVMMLHQRGVVDEIMPSPGGYGGADPCTSIVHPTVTTINADGSIKTGAAIAGLVLAVDAAISADGARVAFVSTGNASNQPVTINGVQVPSRVFMTETGAINSVGVGCRPDGVSAPCSVPGRGPPPTAAPTADGGVGGSAGSIPAPPVPCSRPADPAVPTVVGEPIALAFAGDGALVVQSREPAMLAFADGRNVALSSESRADTGHKVFHANAGGGIACASCHAEGNDDGRVWNFSCIGARRTQSLHTGLRGTEPFHWSGDESDIDKLMKDVFVARMSGPSLASDQTNLLLNWIDGQPRVPRAAPADPAAVERGRALFNDTTRVGCVVCHSGTRFTNNQSVDVGTGAAFQVPSLVGVGTRAPFMHDGCAQTMRDRFSPTCGGDKHGVVSDLSQAQISDLIAYLNSI